jgi:hypothetical protein
MISLSERAWFAYAEVAAKTSTLLALVVTARQKANMPVKATVIANRCSVFATKYRIRMLAIGINEASTVTRMSTVRSIFFSSYRQIPDSGSSATGVLKW